MKQGDLVEVKKIWAGGPSPSADWFGGYEFVREMPQGRVLVRQTSGVFEGVESFYPASEVRPARRRDNSVESDCQKDCEKTFAHDAKSRNKCVKGCHGELVGTGLWDKDNPGGKTPYQEVYEEAYREAVRQGLSEREAQEYAAEVVRAKSDDDLNMLGGALDGYASNPVNSGWLWLGVAALLGAGIWWWTKKQEAKSWVCRAGYRCTRSANAGMFPWEAENLITKEVSLHSDDPENMKDLTLVETAPDGTWAMYALEKPAVMSGLDVYGSLV